MSAMSMAMPAGLIVALLLTSSAHAADRSPAIKAEFQRSTPCLTMGAKRGACPGY